MTTNPGEYFINLVRPLFPNGADINYDQTEGDLVIRVFWILDPNSDRPNKPSKIINLRISSEALGDYSNLSSDEQKRADQFVIDFVEDKLRTFNPDYESPYGASPPTEKWLISTRMLNG